MYTIDEKYSPSLLIASIFMNELINSSKIKQILFDHYF